MLMYGANNQDKATTFLNQLDAASTNLIIPHMLQNNWSYAAAKQALCDRTTVTAEYLAK
ncbi:hypothetical protein DSO57_1032680 [Entomophthora muscae]|uniref:Uncharacterized protein n=1 Tax=Entomophthora muscae TaxID=34485 RepID=A0ACC2SD93_9FUNG|nr:hypothetical protein DSO57_1032680 [Entomophthora muscae]